MQVADLDTRQKGTSAYTYKKSNLFFFRRRGSVELVRLGEAADEGFKLYEKRDIGVEGKGAERKTDGRPSRAARNRI
jgi:hypothetical protein